MRIGTFPKVPPYRPKFQTAVLIVAIIFFGTVCGGGRDAGQKAAPTVQNLRTLAKLYGYLRYFHPSDEGAQVDWDALAIHAASGVKDAPDAAALKTALEEVFLPIAPSMKLYFEGKEPTSPSGQTPALPAPSFSSASPAPSPDTATRIVSWQHMGLGTGAADSIYRSIRLNRPFEMAGHATLAKGIEAAKYAGGTVNLSAWVKVTAHDMSSRAQLWLRVDRASGPGFFDNMSDRPIMTPEWAECTISGPIAADAQRIFFGALASGKGEFLIDGFRLSIKDAAGHEEKVALPNAGFEDGDISTLRNAWNLESPGMEARVGEDDFHEGKRALSLATRVFPYSQPLFEKRAPADGLIDKEIGRGLFARIPLAIESDDQGTLPRADSKELEKLRASLTGLLRTPQSGANESVRLGDIVIAWNVFQHFFPYFDVVKVDWDAVLTRALERALADRTEEEFLRTLNWLVARLDDGHGGVYHALQQKLGTPPFRVEWIEGKAVVTASRDASFKRGDVLLAVDGRKAEDMIRADEEFLSGSPQWKRFKACSQFALAPAGTKSSAKIQRGGEVLETAFEHAAQMPVIVPPALQPIAPLKDGVFYVDLSRASWQDISSQIRDLAAARGVVFDLRGYPNGNHQVLCHLLREPDKSSAWMKVPLVVLPDREGWTYQEMGWNLITMTPHIGGRVVFLTDGRAISYSESFLSFVEHYKLGEIVGEPTAGANGNVNPLTLPGGYNVAWTGMKVVKHDGSQHHTIGILPTVPCRRTVAGVVSGRDELLEKALEVIGKAEEAEPEKFRAHSKIEERNSDEHARRQDAAIAAAPANRQEELAHHGEKIQNRLQPPEKIMDAIGLKEGMVVGEVGAGWGRFTVHLARRVGNTGLVYANDIDKGALSTLEQRIKKDGLTNIRIILGQVHDPGFPPRSLDMAFMINVYNAFEDPAGFLRNIAPALKPGGTLAIVLDDPAKSGGESERSATREEFLASVDKAGYKVEKEETFLERDGLYVLRLK